MNNTSPTTNANDTAKSALGFWDKAAPQWDAGIACSGNDYWKYLQKPTLTRLCAVQPGEHVLDLATGNGIVARWLADQGAGLVLATDGSQEMVDLARVRSAGMKRRVDEGSDQDGEEKQTVFTVEKLDLCDERAVDTFVAQREGGGYAGGFDVITVNMALMDLAELRTLARLVRHMLKPGTGRFVATMLHPLFFTGGASRCVEVDEDEHGERRFKRYMKVDRYLEPQTRRVSLYLPDPVDSGTQMMFHRPLHELLAPFFAEGLLLDALEEPNFDASFVDDTRPYGSKSYTQIPKLLAFRLRRLAVDRQSG